MECYGSRVFTNKNKIAFYMAFDKLFNGISHFRDFWSGSTIGYAITKQTTANAEKTKEAAKAAFSSYYCDKQLKSHCVHLILKVIELATLDSVWSYVVNKIIMSPQGK